MKKLVVISMIAALLMVGAIAIAQEEAKPEATKGSFEYVGDKACKMCHKDVHAAWSETPHAKAFAALSAEEQKNEACVVCHITGSTAKGELIENVTCEACHGPGSAYKSPKIMSKKWNDDPATYKAAAMEAGLIYPSEKDCVRCHKKEGNPNFKPFDWERMAPLVHPTATEEAPE